jgi:undecaprenyl diphosphate synthase
MILPMTAAFVYTPEELSRLDPSLSPKHVAIIMDGNRRWARQKGLLPMMGHWEGAEALVSLVRAAYFLGIQRLTVYSFSTENNARSQVEIDALMELFEEYLISQREMMVREGVRLDAIGDIEKLPSSVRRALDETREATALGDKVHLILAMNYGARDEICRAVAKIVAKGIQEITEETISMHLDTRGWDDPDLLIRTSGEMRLSNFLLWQISYTEFYTADVLFPDFSPKDLYQAVLSFQERQRRGGK